MRLLDFPDEVLERILDFLDRRSLKKVIKAAPALVRFEKRWMATHLKKVYTVRDGVAKWCTQFVMPAAAKVESTPVYSSFMPRVSSVMRIKPSRNARKLACRRSPSGVCSRR